MKKVFYAIAMALSLQSCSGFQEKMSMLVAPKDPAPQKEEVRYMYSKNFAEAETTLVTEEFFDLLHARWELKKKITDCYVALTKTTNADKARSIRLKIQQLNTSLQTIEDRLSYLVQVINDYNGQDAYYDNGEKCV